MTDPDNILARPEWTLPARWVTAIIAATLVVTVLLSGGYMRLSGNDQASSSPMPLNEAMHRNAALNAAPISVATTAR